MRKLKLQVQMSLDGFIAGTNQEMDWMSMNWTPDIIEYIAQITEPVDTILLGRNLATGFIPHWTAAYNSPTPELGAEKMVLTPKVVFTKTLTTSEWKNTVLANGDLTEEIEKLKNQKGGDIIAYGGGMFVSSLIQNNLIDEYHLIINPTAIGKGLPIFKKINQYLNLNLEECRKFDGGMALLKYTSQK